MDNIPAIAIHGGAGAVHNNSISSTKKNQYYKVLNDALKAGYESLFNGDNAIEAITRSVMIMEDNPLFNAGKGSVLNHYQEYEMDASIMDGCFLKCGAVAGVELVKNPVMMAREVMDNSDYCFLSGKNVKEFIKEKQIPLEDKDYFYSTARYEQYKQAVANDETKLDHDYTSFENNNNYGTVGAVAIDNDRNLAAATSTGGMTNKKYGRIGDTPVIGAGTYANNNTCAISCTGYGEYFIRTVAAHEISSMIEWGKMPLNEAVDFFIKNKMEKVGGRGGLIAVDKYANIIMPFNTHGMYRASLRAGEKEFISI